MLAVEHVLATLPLKSVLEMLSFVRGRVDAVEARIVAERYEAGASDRGVEGLLREDGRTSKVAAAKRSLRGKPPTPIQRSPTGWRPEISPPSRWT